MSDDSEQFRHACECKFWLAETGGDPAKVADLMIRITAKRGKAAAERLRDGMREQYKIAKGNV